MQLPPLSSLVVFESAARQLSFTLAAREMNVTQAAVSRQIRSLEENLGTPLFTRSHRAVQLTAEGRRFRHAVAMGLEHIASAAGDIRSIISGPKLTIAADLSVASLWLMPRISRFRGVEPEVEVRVLATDQEIGEIDEHIDAAIQYGDGTWPNFRARFLFGEEVFPVCSPEYLAGRPALSTPGDLLAETLLYLDDDHWNWVDWRAWLSDKGVHVPPSQQGLQVNNYPMLIQAARDGQGIALGWRHLVDELLATGVLVRPIDTSLRTSRAFYLVTAADRAPTAETLAFCEWVLAEAQ